MRGNFREKVDAAGSTTGNTTGNTNGNANGNATGKATGKETESAIGSATGSAIGVASRSAAKIEFKNSRIEDSKETNKSNTSQSAFNSSSKPSLASKPHGLPPSAGNPPSNSLASKSQISNHPGTSKSSISISSTSNVPMPPSWKEEDFHKLKLMMEEHQKKMAKGLER